MLLQKWGHLLTTGIHIPLGKGGQLSQEDILQCQLLGSRPIRGFHASCWAGSPMDELGKGSTPISLSKEPFKRSEKRVDGGFWKLCHLTGSCFG